jgi:DNA-binding transcriptional ArsR family regulator
MRSTLTLVWRLSVFTNLCNGVPQSISRLTAGTNLSRQAVTKHRRVLANAGMVRSVRIGRENLFELEPQPIEEHGIISIRYPSSGTMRWRG